MKLLWIGEQLGPKMERFVLENNGRVMSALISERNIIKGLDELGVNMDSINSCQISVTCNISRRLCKFIPEERWHRKSCSNDISIKYRNIKYVDILLRKHELRKKAKEWALQNQAEDKVSVIVYNMHSPYMRAAIEVKKIIPSATLYVIVTDLPLYMDLAMGKVKKLLKRIDWSIIKKYNRRFDKFILYAKPMADLLNLRCDQWLLMEGSYDATILGERKEKERQKISIMYSGMLTERFGIPELLEAMEYLDGDTELWLTGVGDMVERINEKSKEDNRIRYFGFLPSRQTLLDLQANATMLINPRRDDEDASRYCFPSKLFEFMASGNPVISCYLEGIPEEYRKYLVELKHVSPKDIAEAVGRVISMTKEERFTFGDNARRFIIEEKNYRKQAKKIADFIKKDI